MLSSRIVHNGRSVVKDAEGGKSKYTEWLNCVHVWLCLLLGAPGRMRLAVTANPGKDAYIGGVRPISRPPWRGLVSIDALR